MGFVSQSRVESVDFLLGSENYFLVFGKRNQYSNSALKSNSMKKGITEKLTFLETSDDYFSVD